VRYPVSFLAGKAEVHLFYLIAVQAVAASAAAAAAAAEDIVELLLVSCSAGKAEVHLIYPTAQQAAAAADGFRSPWARKALRMPDSEPPIEVKVLEIKPAPADWQVR
jgi:hypothetical protein